MRIDEISMTRAERFLATFNEASRAPVNTSVEGRLAGNALFDMFAHGSNGIIIKMFSIHNGSRNKGEGSTALAFLCGLADQFKVNLYLHALSQRRSISERGLNTRDLVAFYERHGFVAENPVAAKAFQTDPHKGLKMVRRPIT